MARGLGMLKDSKSRNLSKIFYDILICTFVDFEDVVLESKNLNFRIFRFSSHVIFIVAFENLNF